MAQVQRTYEGPAGQRRLVALSYPGGATLKFEGPKGQERKVSCHIASLGATYHFEGARGNELRVRAEYGDGDVYYLSGVVRGRERRVLLVSPSRGHTTFFCGEKGAERVLARIFANGENRAFDGPRGQERQVRRSLPNGTVCHYQGERGHERASHALLPDGRRIGRGRLLWLVARAWALKREIALFWQAETQKRLCAPNGAGRRLDLASFAAEFGA